MTTPCIFGRWWVTQRGRGSARRSTPASFSRPPLRCRRNWPNGPRRRSSAPVFEIYGCSEAGQLATRRTIDGPVWRCLDGFRLYHDAAGCWASGPAEADVLLADEIELVDGGGFILRGRTADLVNIAGKRSSLAYLTRQLLAIDGVEDGVFLMPDDDCGRRHAAAGRSRAGTGLTAATILEPVARTHRCRVPAASASRR